MLRLNIKGKSEVHLLRPTKIIGLGLNYLDHIEETGKINPRGETYKVPQEPILFSKATSSLIGSNEQIVIPKIIKKYRFNKIRVDSEAELAIIIKDRCNNLKESDVFDHILGFTCMNDVSERNIQSMDKSGWFRGKSFDTFGPIGPIIVLPENIGDPQNLNISCRINGRTVQDSNTSNMLFKITEIVSFVSQNFTLFPDDIITTGTPAGCSPVSNNDIVEVEIENIGILKNFVSEEI